jgi:hypothetical protein
MRDRRPEADPRFTPHGSTSSPSRAKSRDVSRFLGAGREQSRCLAIVRRSRKVNVGQAPTAAPLPIPHRKKMFLSVITSDATVHCVGQEVM